MTPQSFALLVLAVLELFLPLVLLVALAGLVFSICDQLAPRGNKKTTHPYSVFRRKFKISDLFLAACLELNALLLLDRVLLAHNYNVAVLALAACLLSNTLLLAYLRLDSCKRTGPVKFFLSVCLALNAFSFVWHLCKDGVNPFLTNCILLNMILLVRFWISSRRKPEAAARLEPEPYVPMSKAKKFLSSAISFYLLAILSFAFLICVFGIEYGLALRYFTNR